MPSRVLCATTLGLEAKIIEIEIDSAFGLRSFDIIGLPDKTVSESKDRISSAIKSINFLPPLKTRLKILINLAPADIKKEGSLFDLPIALAFLLESGQTKFNPIDKIFIGELSLDGRLRKVKGVLSIAILALDKKIKELIIPEENLIEASLIQKVYNNSQLKIVGLKNLKDVIDYLEGRKKIKDYNLDYKKFFKDPNYSIDFADIKSQSNAKRVLKIAAAGGHNLLMLGSPGGGKTILAKALPSILPKLDLEESLELTKIYSIAGLLESKKPLISARPFRAPHHSISKTALIGGSNPPRLGEISLAHRGVLFLDEFPEFHRDILESLRQPLEEGEITVCRAKYHYTFPTFFSLIAAANPCPCGYRNDLKRECTCLSSQLAKYERKLKGPLIDRIDLLIEISSLEYEKIVSNRIEESSFEIQKLIEKTREIQKQRFKKENKKSKFLQLTNSQMNISQIKKYCRIDFKSSNLLKKYINNGFLTARGYHRVLKVARTIADLEKEEKINFSHVSEALNYRIKKE